MAFQGQARPAVVFLIGKNREDRFNIYTMAREEADKKGLKFFHTWLSAQRHLVQVTTKQRDEVINMLVKADLTLTRAKRLKYHWCQPVEKVTSGYLCVDPPYVP